MTPEKLLKAKANMLDDHFAATIPPDVMRTQMLDYVAGLARESGDSDLQRRVETLITRYKIATYAEDYFSGKPDRKSDPNFSLSIRLLKVV